MPCTRRRLATSRELHLRFMVALSMERRSIRCFLQRSAGYYATLGVARAPRWIIPLFPCKKKEKKRKTFSISYTLSLPALETSCNYLPLHPLIHSRTHAHRFHSAYHRSWTAFKHFSQLLTIHDTNREEINVYIRHFGRKLNEMEINFRARIIRFT